MKKIKIFTVLLILSVLTTNSFAQRGPGNRPPKEKVEAMKIGFLTDYLDLSSEEARGFWPVYNSYQDELEKLRKSHRQNILNDKTDFDSMNDAELEKLVVSELTFHQNELDIQKKYHPQFKK